MRMHSHPHLRGIRFALSFGATLCALSIAFASSGAQTPPLAGTVRDMSGTPVPHADVVILGLDRSTTTDDAGRFAFRTLPPGRHELFARQIGYAPARASVVIPESGDTVRVALALRPSTVELAAVQVTATRFSADPLDVTQSTVELSGQELNRNVSGSVAQTLADEPGLAMRYNGPAANLPVVRGLTGDRVLVLHNGERVGDLAAPTPDHALTIDPLAATSIEVVRGPAALLYGSNALGGVVNVISRDIPTAVPNHLEGVVAGQGESVNPGGGISVLATMPLAASVALSVGGNHRSTSDVRMGGGNELLNSFARQSGGHAGLGYVGERISGGLAYQGFRLRYGLPADPADPELLTIEANRQQVSARTDLRFDGTRIPLVRLDATGQWYEHDEIEPDGAIGTHFDLRTQTFSATARSSIGRHVGAFGGSGFFKQYEAIGEEALTPPADSRSLGIYAFHDFPLFHPDTARAVHLHLGARYDHTTVGSKQGDPRFGPPVERRFGTFSGSAGLVFPLGPDVTLNANVARAFRAPTVEELFSDGVHAAAGTFDKGNVDLDAETNTGGELVLRARAARLTAQLSGYYNKITDFITADVVGDTAIVDETDPAIIDTFPLVRYAQDNATLRGAEGQVEVELFPGWVIGGVGDVVRGELDDDTPLPFMPAARLGALVRYQRGGWSGEADYRHGFAQRRVPPAAIPDDPSAVATAAYDLVNFSLGYTLISGGLVHSITGRVDNLFDEEYRDATSRIKRFASNPGRNFALVYKLLF